MPGGLEFVDTNVLVYAYDRAGGEKPENENPFA
jgi:predicted nucleic acid-binding protein